MRKPGVGPMYEAADLFRQRCLVEGKSFLWPEHRVWSPENISAARNALLGAGAKNFFEQWRDQLSEQPEEVHRVVADTVAFYHLLGTKNNPGNRLADGKRVIGWKLNHDPPELGFLEQAYSKGHQSVGMLRPMSRKGQIDFYLQFAWEISSRGVDTTDAEACKHLANEVKSRVKDNGAAGNLLLHLFFPERFEYLGPDTHKRGIVDAFRDRSGGEEDVDDALLNIRPSLAKEYGENFDYYDNVWPPEDAAKIIESGKKNERVESMYRGPLNVVFYGPPGTGKTYLTQRRAVEILRLDLEDPSNKEISELYREYLNEGRIEFVTFHPSYSYEEFVEGFRYDPDAGVPTLHDGVFKRLVKRASTPRQILAREDARIWKVSLGDYRAPHLFERCMQNGEIAIGWFGDRDLTGLSREDIAGLFGEGKKNDINSVNNFINEMRIGDYVAVRKSPREIRAIGVVSGEYQYKGEKYEDNPHTRPVEWLDQQDHDIYEMNDSKELVQPTVYPLDQISPDKFVKLLPESDETERPYVLIIDEINRGNLSRIFGELITLLEGDKRRGAENELSARLVAGCAPTISVI